eukprot:5984043-Prymnesium_polylepis.1
MLNGFDCENSKRPSGDRGIPERVTGFNGGVNPTECESDRVCESDGIRRGCESDGIRRVCESDGCVNPTGV